MGSRMASEIAVENIKEFVKNINGEAFFENPSSAFCVTFFLFRPIGVCFAFLHSQDKGSIRAAKQGFGIKYYLQRGDFLMNFRMTLRPVLRPVPSRRKKQTHPTGHDTDRNTGQEPRTKGPSPLRRKTNQGLPTYPSTRMVESEAPLPL